MTVDELRDLFLDRLVRRAGGSRRRWRLVLGEPRRYARDTHPHCNWSFTPGGSAAEVAAAEALADELRGEHPLVE